MIRPGFLDPEARKDLIELARDGSAAHRLARRANALVLLNDGMSYTAVANVLFIDDDTVRTWHRLYEEDGIEGLASFGYEGSACRLSDDQQDKLKAWIAETLPRNTRAIGAWIERECGIAYQGRSGLIALLHRLGMEHRKPKAVSRKLDPEKQAAFIKAYEDLLNYMADDDEAVLFGDAVHPTHAVRPVGCWGPKDVEEAVEQTSGRQRLNIHGAIDLETGQTRMLEAATVDVVSTIMLLTAIEAMYPGKRLIHLFLDNAQYHHAKLMLAWLARPQCRIKLHFVPAYCPHLNPIERLWGLMHKHITHNRCYERFADFRDAMLTLLRKEVPRNWVGYCDAVQTTPVSSRLRIFGFWREWGISQLLSGRAQRTPARQSPARRSHCVFDSVIPAYHFGTDKSFPDLSGPAGNQRFLGAEFRVNAVATDGGNLCFGKT